ncbi:MAG TPA: flagellar hook-associated protein FlgL [Burkholderiaceae bacterium]|nr:flagellar hook-associated protein FlgL [Burkholderiaceae bacterium]
MMRVSTYAFYSSGELSMMQRQRDVLDTQTQISSGKRINTPADDPVGAADAAGMRTALSQFDQFKNNQGRASYLLNLAESTLGTFVDTAQTIKEKLIAAGNGTYSNAERLALATDLKGILGQMVGLANSTDGAGGYLFAGSREATAPFSQSGLAVSFNGDDTLLRLEVSSNRLQQVKQGGDDLFLKLRPGNGTFTTAAAASNTGSGVIDPGDVTNPALLTGSSYTIGFSVAGGVTSYQAVRASDSAVVASGTYTAPAGINFDGQHVKISGSPANGDTFQVAPAGYQSIFDTVAAAVQLLSKGVTTDADKAQLQTALSGLNASTEQVLDHLSLKRAEYGSALSELDGYSKLNDDRQLQYRSRLSTVEDLDLAQATSELSRRQTTFQAAIQSYSAISKLSLFNYLD